MFTGIRMIASSFGSTANWLSRNGFRSSLGLTANPPLLPGVSTGESFYRDPGKR